MKEKTPQEQEAIRRAILGNPKFMADIREAARDVAAGNQGRPWSEVKKELGLK